MEVEFDPSIITYEDILDIFWKNHNPLRENYYKGRQYMSLILYQDQNQKNIAEKSKAEWERILAGDIQTEIASFSIFHMAEDYHQKYYLKRFKSAVLKLNSLFSNHNDFVNSTLTARLNGLAKGFGTLAELKKEINDWGLSPENTKELYRVLSEIRW